MNSDQTNTGEDRGSLPVFFMTIPRTHDTSGWRVMSSSLVPLKTHRAEGADARYIYRGSNVLLLVWCGSLERGVLSWVSSSSLDHGSKALV
ncbi:hypothetical protein TNCV_3312591 [Trichonephila clavipes]|nr:hypothetical protein TNCV_3312591 [Trichonephila clavipes]